MHILLINAHPDYDNEVRATNQLYYYTLRHLEKQAPNAFIESLKLYAPEAMIPALTQETLREPKRIEEYQDRLIDQWRRADLVMIFSPLFNLNIVSRMKDYIDSIMVADKTYRFDETGSVGLLDGAKPVLYVQTSGGNYDFDPDDTKVDFAPQYMRTVLHVMGINKMTLLRVQGLRLQGADRNQILTTARQHLARYVDQFIQAAR